MKYKEITLSLTSPTTTSWLAKQHFDDPVELKAGVIGWLKPQVKEFYGDGITNCC